ncbi:orotidine-5'-phosphate decarboxylase [Fodinicurvata halophila]|uniref:Orotidine 5'-phosphate decarboxylase n=1 Tax=Fodinicurvata halophila TaxID=1419723 RepID=A0ABV8UH17_9PROT
MTDGLESVFIALDTSDPLGARHLVRTLGKGPRTAGFKIGKEFFTAHGPVGTREVTDGYPLFLDLKFHDIPNTVAGAIRSSLQLRPAIVNVHASGGAAMMRAAAQAADEAATAFDAPRPWVIAVTVLTSLDDSDLDQVGQAGPAREQVLRLARLAQDCGLDGVVCSPRELADLRRHCGPDFRLVVPGIRPDWADSGDQKRTMTPGEAISAGADRLVIGRPVTAAKDPLAALQRLASDLA